MAEKLKFENYAGDNFASDQLVDWVQDKLTEIDFVVEDGNFYCGCESKPEILGVYHLYENADKWESWMEQEGSSDENVIAIYYCYECKKWFVDCDF